MSVEETCAHGRDNGNVTIHVADSDLIFCPVELDTTTPTGGKIAKAAGFSAAQHPYVLQWLRDGDLEGIRVQEEADLEKGDKFIVTESSSSNRITINDEPLDWPAGVISGAVVRKLGKVPPEELIYLERTDEADLLVEDEDLVKIKAEGVEEFKSRKPESWELNVQGRRLTFMEPVVPVADALRQAEFDPNAWLIFLKVAGQPKRQLTIGDSVDLRAEGVEKIRLTAKDVNNGEVRSAPRRDFALREDDEEYLNGLGLNWETESEGGHRWLIIHAYPVPDGYNVSATTLALLIPPTYPQAQIDMFYVHPPLQKAGGSTIPATQSKQNIRGLSFQRWSRHRGQGSRWTPNVDNVITHLALVESAIAKEVGQ